VVVGQAGDLLTSTDGATWKVHTEVHAGTISDVAFAAGQFVALGGPPGMCLRSCNGDSWDLVDTGCSNNLEAVATDGVNVVATGVSGSFLLGVGHAGPAVIITNVTQKKNPFRFLVEGSNFQPGCQVTINGMAAPMTTFKSVSAVMLGKGSALRSLLPPGLPANLVLINPDGSRSAPFSVTPH